MQKIHKKVLELFNTKFSIKILYGVGSIIVLVLVFSLGVSVGFHKASFGHAWAENYERNFGTMPGRPPFDNFPNASGAVGKIIKIGFPTIIVEDKDNTEKVVLIKDDTQIQKTQEKITENDLKIDDFVVIIGSPNTQGQIEAKFIRVMPLGMPVPPSKIPTPTK